MLYLYPAGAEIDGQTLTEPTALTPCRARIGGILHGPEVCELWTDEELAAWGIRRVMVDPLPLDGNGWPCLPGEPVDVEDGPLVRRTWPNATPDTAGWTAHLEQLAAAARAERNARLTACDWTQMPDAPLTPEAKATWAAYRQALRDVPEQAGFPVEVVWPVAAG